MSSSTHEHDSLQEVLDLYRRNFPAFEQQLERLERDHLGEFAVVANGEVLGIHSTEEEAREAATGESVIFEIRLRRLRFAPI